MEVPFIAIICLNFAQFIRQNPIRPHFWEFATGLR